MDPSRRQRTQTKATAEEQALDQIAREAGTVTRQYGTVGAGDGGRCGAGTGVVVARSGYMAATTPGFALAELGEGSEVVAASALAISV